MLKLTIEEVTDYLGIDYIDDRIEKRLKHLINVAHLNLVGSLGENYPENDERVKEIALIVISDLYDNHDLSDNVSSNIRRLVVDFSLQIKLELKRKGCFRNEK